MISVEFVDGNPVQTEIPAAEQLVSDCECGLDADNRDEAVRRHGRLAIRSLCSNTILVQYDEEDGDCIECGVIGRRWRAVN